MQRNYEQGTPKRLKVLSGSWSCRMGELLSGFDSWWKFQPDQPTEPVVESVLESLERVALPRMEAEMDRLTTSTPSVVVLEDDD